MGSENTSAQGRHEQHAYGPFRFLNPTIRHSQLKSSLPKNPASSEDKTLGDASTNAPKDPSTMEDKMDVNDIYMHFRTRDNRKGRHALAISPTVHASNKVLTPLPTITIRTTLSHISLMFTTFPYWDISYLIAIIFTFGSVIWCVNAFFAWLPLQDPATEFEGEISNAGGITAFIGATVFEIGSVFLMLEAVNEGKEECFGWEIEEVLEERGLLRVKEGACVHHHHNKRALVGRMKESGGKPSDGALEHTSSDRNWTWLPTWHELRTHYFKEVGFLACLSQMIGATVFWISGFTALPPIYSRLTSEAALNGAFWLPQVIGGTGFIISGTLFMLETQERWYLPAWKVLGWHIGAWNLLGGIGFTLCGVLGFANANSGAVYQGSLATFWGSWCFLLGSVIQWFESLDKHPVTVREGSIKTSGSQESNV